MDVSTIYKGYFSDSSRMFCIGTVNAEKRRLVDVARECVERGLAEVKPWGFLGDMGQAVHDCARAHGYTVVREVGGHGVGLKFHEEPFVSYVTKRGTDMLLVPGMIFTIEPMIKYGPRGHHAGQGQRLDHPHRRRPALGAMGNHGAGDRRRP
ncbi:MAG: M24 family metallopeptidase [Bilophila sp.]